MVKSLAGTNLEQDIRELVAEILETDPSEIASDALFVKDLGMDSMMALEILAGIEKKYKIAIPEDVLTRFTNLNQTVEIVKKIINKEHL